MTLDNIKIIAETLATIFGTLSGTVDIGDDIISIDVHNDSLTGGPGNIILGIHAYKHLRLIEECISKIGWEHSVHQEEGPRYNRRTIQIRGPRTYHSPSGYYTKQPESNLLLQIFQLEDKAAPGVDGTGDGEAEAMQGTAGSNPIINGGKEGSQDGL